LLGLPPLLVFGLGGWRTLQDLKFVIIKHLDILTRKPAIQRHLIFLFGSVGLEFWIGISIWKLEERQGKKKQKGVATRVKNYLRILKMVVAKFHKFLFSHWPIFFPARLSLVHRTGKKIHQMFKVIGDFFGGVYHAQIPTEAGY
jgi:hypothetical protein